MSSRKLTLSIPLSLATMGGLLMIAGLALALVECLGITGDQHQCGWAGVCIALIGKHLMNRSLAADVKIEISDSTEREIEAFQVGRRAALFPVE